jgi:subtilisin family serine protease
LDTRPAAPAIAAALAHQDKQFSLPTATVVTHWGPATTPTGDYVTDNYMWVGMTCPATPQATPMQIAGHGLFVAGLINQVAPNVNLNVVRVLSDYGAQSLGAVIAGLNLMDLQRGSSTSVVNLSLTVSVPTTQGELNAALSWLQKNKLRTDYLLKTYHGGLADGARAATTPLYDLMQALSTHRVYFVAAAGNDHQQNAPRVPALFNSALSVAAVGHNNTLAPYSNWATGPGQANGIATYGGESSCGGSDSVVGLYTSTSTARWVGTSFATPFISGLVANLLANYPNKPATGPSWLLTPTPWTLTQIKMVLQGFPGVIPATSGNPWSIIPAS